MNMDMDGDNNILLALAFCPTFLPARIFQSIFFFTGQQQQYTARTNFTITSVLQDLHSRSISKIERLAHSHKCFLTFKKNQICDNKRKVQNYYYTVGEGSKKKSKAVIYDRPLLNLLFLIPIAPTTATLDWSITQHFINWITQVWNFFPYWSPSLPATDLLLSSNCTCTHFLVLTPIYQLYGYVPLWGCGFQAI